MRTDGGARGIGANLFQKQVDGKLHPVYVVNRRTSEPQRFQNSSKFELIAKVEAVSRLTETAETAGLKEVSLEQTRVLYFYLLFPSFVEFFFYTVRQEFTNRIESVLAQLSM